MELIQPWSRSAFLERLRFPGTNDCTSEADGFTHAEFVFVR